jgi:wobble nucleotide-excising tRNase
MYGGAIRRCQEDEDGTLWVDNGEYASQVNYCPFCGYQARVQVLPEEEERDRE